MSAVVTNDIIRAVVFVLAWVNSFLVTHGQHPLPVIDETQVSWVVTFVVSVWAMLKESPFKKYFAKKAPSEVQNAPVVPTVAPKAVVPAAQEPAPTAPVSPVDQPSEPRAPESK
jgi:SPP1 family holin